MKLSRCLLAAAVACYTGAVQANGDSLLMGTLLEGNVAESIRHVGQRADLEKPNWEGITPLIRASARGYVSVVRELLLAGVVVDQRDSHGTTALGAAAHRGHAEIVAMLADAGADVNTVGWLQNAGAQGRQDVTALMASVESKRIEVVEALLRRGANVAYINSERLSALVKAVATGFDAAIPLLVRHGADPSAAHGGGVTALGVAIQHGQLGSLYALLKAGADPDGRTGYLTVVEAERKLWAVPLIIAAMVKNTRAVEALLDAGANPDQFYRLSGLPAWAFQAHSPLTGAISVRDAEIVALLLKGGANPEGADQADKIGALPVHAAAAWGDLRIIDSLINAGANPFARDRRGEGVLHYAAANSNLEALRHFVKMGIPVNARSRDRGRTALMAAAAGGQVATLRQLVELGADARLLSEERETASAVAAAGGHKDAVTYLLQVEASGGKRK